MGNKKQTTDELINELKELQKKFDLLSDSYKNEILDPKRAKEEALLHSERLLKESQSVARLGSYVWDITTGIWKSSEILDEIFGIDENYVRSFEGWADLIHPNWRDTITDYVANEVVGKHQRFDIEYKIIRHNTGEERWVHGLGEVESDSNDQPKTLIGTITDITMRKCAEEALIVSESNLQALINNKQEGIWSLDINYNLIVCNDFFKNSYFAAYNVELKLGANLLGILSPELKTFWKPKYDAALTGEKLKFEFYETIQGILFYFDVFLNPIFSEGKVTGVSALSVDVTERRRSEQELRESETRFSQLANASFEGIAITDGGIIFDSNEQLSKLLGYTHEELIGMHALDFVAPESRKIVIKNLRSSFEIPYEHSAIRKDGTIFPVEIQARMVPYKGRVVRVTAIRDITQRKWAEKALTESERKFRLFVETAIEGIMAADKDDKITFLNRRMAEMIGYMPEEIIGSTFSSFIYPEELDDFHQKMRSRRQGKGEVFERKFQRKDGTTLWALVSASPIYNSEGIYNGSLGMLTDITDRKAASDILRESEERFRSVAESANDAIITVNNKGMISGWNRGAVKIFGYDADEITGYDIELIIPELSVENRTKAIKSANTDKYYDFTGRTIELIGKQKSGKEFPVEISMAEWETTTGKFFTGIFRDITDRKRAEETIIKAKEKAEERDRLKSSFLANMSHEIRTPMNGIMGFAELLKNPLLTKKEQHEYICIIEDCGSRMLNILNDLIDISKIESGQVIVNTSHCNINRNIGFIYAFFKHEAEQKGLKIVLRNGLPDNDANIITDPEKINAILTNLVKNAIKFTKEGTIEFGYDLKSDRDPVSTEQSAVLSKIKSRSAKLEFFVKDTGEGIPEEQKEIIFERFRQGSESLTRNYEGAGLGLAISKSYVKMLGGTIRVVNNPDGDQGQRKGSIFYFTIPYHAVSGEKDMGKKAASEIQSESQNAKLKVLITEDDMASEKLLSSFVKGFSKEIIIAKTGSEAIEACRNNPEIDLVLMDLKMPEMDGYCATREIRMFNKKVVIIAQSAYAKSGDKEKALEAGCNDYISKPLSKTLLMSLVQKHFKI
jgi:PAS domain S-box-containing protein